MSNNGQIIRYQIMEYEIIPITINEKPNNQIS